MARQSAKVAPSVSVHWSENAELVSSLLTAADEYIGKVRQSKLAMVTDQVAYVIAANATFRPTYDVAVAEFRSVEGSDAKFPMSQFTTKLSERGKVVRNDQGYVFPISVKLMNTIVFWEGDADYHEGALEAFVAFCAKQGREISFGGYQSWLSGWRDPEGAWYDDEGNFTVRGQLKVDQAAQVAELTATSRWCAMNFELNLSGMAPGVQLAWIDAAIHDLEALRAKVVKPMSAKDKQAAKKLLSSNVDNGLKFGGDRITTAMENAVTAQS